MRVQRRSDQQKTFLPFSFLGLTKSPSEYVDLSSLNVAPNSFSHRLDVVWNDQLQNDVKMQLQMIDHNASLLLKSPTHHSLNTYKQAVRGFLKFVLKSAVQMRQIYGRRIDRKVLVVIDQKLSLLSEQMLQSQTTTIEWVESLDGIRGLLIDLIS